MEVGYANTQILQRFNEKEIDQGGVLRSTSHRKRVNGRTIIIVTLPSLSLSYRKVDWWI